MNGRSLAGAILLVGLGLARPGGAGPPHLIPERTARPIPPVAWSAFLPVRSDSLPELPMRGATRPSRWLGLEHALGMHTVAAESTALPIAQTSAEADAAGLLVPDTSATGATLAGESPAFLAAWEEAILRAREDDAPGCEAALRGTAPATLSGEQAVDRLAFAAAVERGDRAEADALGVRIEVSDPARASRLEAWKQLEAGQGQDAGRTLAGIPDPSPGIQAARAMAAWQAGSGFEDPDGDAWTEVEGLPRVALALVAAAHRSDPGLVLDRVPETDVPPDWKPTFEALRHPGASSPAEEGDVALYRRAAEAFTAGNDAQARSLLDDLLAAWPASSYRAQGLLLRAHLRLAAGEPDDANSDLRALERLVLSSEMELRTTVLRAFWEAQSGFFPEAQSALAQALAQDFGAQVEGEIRFDRVRISRMAGDKPAVDAGILELEEAFPQEPWATRARSDTRAEGWREPWRSVPGSPTSVAQVAAPTQGPWGLLLWGERVLSREADALSGIPPAPDATVGTSPVPNPVTPSPTPATTVVPSGRLGYLEVGAGAPAFGSLGAGIGGQTGGLLFRAEGGQTLGQANHELPDYRRTSWEIAAARLSTPMQIGVALEGTGRTEDGAPSLGLNPDAVDAYAWGVRGDLSAGNAAEKGFGASVSRMAGKIDAGGSGRWNSTETWFEVRGTAPVARSRWEGRWTSTHFDEEAPSGSENNWLHDLRLVAVRSSGWYLGGRAAIYRDRGLVLPVIGVEKHLGGWQAWLRGEPALLVPSFRQDFVVNGDWNVPTLGLQAERRTIDVEGGLRAGRPEADVLTLIGKVYEVDELRTWEKQGGLWVERSMNDANGHEFSASGTKHLGDFRASASGTYRKVRAEDRQVPYLPVVEGNVELAYDARGWRAATRLLGVDGREDDFQNAYGSFLRWDLEGALKLAAPGFLPSDRIEVAVRLENLTDVADRRWPGVPGYGRGIFLGVRTLHGRPSGT
jgi:hypothetical protein